MVSTILETNLNDAIEEWQIRSSCQVAHIMPFAGSGNSSFQLELADDSKVVLRLHGRTEHLGVDRRREQEILGLVAGIGPRNLYFTQAYSVFEYIEAHGIPSITQLAQGMAKIHEISGQTPTDWTPNDTIEDYLRLLPKDSESIRSLASSVDTIDWTSSPVRLCHIDANPGNVLMTPQGVRLIDWEYSRFGPVVYDLAVLFQTHKFSAFEIAEFLSAYPLVIDRELLAAAQLTYRIIELMWLVITDPLDWPTSRIDTRASEIRQLSND